MEHKELKPCCKCGREAYIISSQTFAWCDVKYRVECSNYTCEERTPRYEHKCDAINAWNRRANDGT